MPRFFKAVAKAKDVVNLRLDKRAVKDSASFRGDSKSFSSSW